MNKMSDTDLLEILMAMYAGRIGQECLVKMIEFNDRLCREVVVERRWGGCGAPWEFNLRDMFRWCELVVKEEEKAACSSVDPGNFVYLVYAAR